MRTKHFNILVVDGNRVSRKVYSKLLHKQFQDQCRILEVERGEDGLYFCETQNIGCVLIDYHLPDMHGLEFLNALNSRMANHYIPVVILTGQGDETTAVQAMKSGAQDYLVKGTFSQELLAQAVQNAIEKVELLEELDRKRHDLEHTNAELKNEIAYRKEVEENLRLFRDLINQTSDALFIINPDTAELIDFNDAVSEALGYDKEELGHMTMLSFDAGIEGKAAWKNMVRTIMISTNRIAESTFRRKDGSEYPVEVNYRYISHDEKNYLVALGRDITERKKVEAKLRDLSNRDGLTGVYNRRFLDETLAVEWKRLRRHKQPLSVIMIDVDFFKKYNDSYGHQAGDQCLKTVASVLQEGVNRPADFVARYGGEEFAVILPDTDKEGAVFLADEFREGINSLEIPHSGSEITEHVTASFGVATMIPGQKAGFNQLLEMADKALYEAKGAGRNQVKAAD